MWFPVKWENEEASSFRLFVIFSPGLKPDKAVVILPCMDMEGATEATGMGGMETPPKEL